MAKKVELNIEIDKDGKIVCESIGTSGPECLDLMSFIDKIPGFAVVDVKRKSEFKDKKVQIATTQTITNG